MLARIDPSGYNTDKPGFRVYFDNYEKWFETVVDKEIKLLELGVNRGGSLQLWRDYFKHGTIVGVDIVPVKVEDTSGRIHVFQGMQQDTALLDRIAKETAPDGFDVIIDDCAHIGEFSHISFWHLFEKHLKPGGIFAIEDWGTGYWGRWADGTRYKDPPSVATWRSRLRPFAENLHASARIRSMPRVLRIVGAAMNHLVRQKFPSHQFGMVGFIKQLVDECGMDDITIPEWGMPPYRPSRFQSMQISHGQVFIIKAPLRSIQRNSP